MFTIYIYHNYSHEGFYLRNSNVLHDEYKKSSSKQETLTMGQHLHSIGLLFRVCSARVYPEQEGCEMGIRLTTCIFLIQAENSDLSD